MSSNLTKLKREICKSLHKQAVKPNNDLGFENVLKRF